MFVDVVAGVHHFGESPILDDAPVVLSIANPSFVGLRGTRLDGRVRLFVVRASQGHSRS